MTVRELKEKIRQLTSTVNEKISEYRSRGIGGRLFEKQVERMKEASMVVDYKTGEVHIPKPRTGELALGLSGKRKGDLERQLLELESFNEKEWQSVSAVKERSEKAVKAWETFSKRYGEVSFDEWEDFVYMMDDIGNYLSDFGYEDVGGSVARAYAETRNKKSFKDHVLETANRVRGKGLTPEDFIDTLTDILIEEGAIDE